MAGPVRYPESPAAQEFLPELEIDQPVRQRRLTVLLRLILLIPQAIVMFFLNILAGITMVIGWFGALFMGRLPGWVAEFLGGYLGYAVRVDTYAYLLVDTYPPFAWDPQNHPVRITLAPGRLNRLAVLFRIFLVIPAGILLNILNAGFAVFAFFFWLIILVLGRNPEPIFGATAMLYRFSFRTQAYFMMLTSAYPKRLFGDEGAPAPIRRSDTRPLLPSAAAKTLLVVLIIFGVFGAAAGDSSYAWLPGRNHWFGHTTQQ